MSFAAMKANKGKDTQALLDKLAQAKKPKYTNQTDERYWEPVKDETGSAFAIIRFLPAPEGEDEPFVKMFHYSYKNEDNGKYYIENCRSTLDQPDPMNELNYALRKTKKEENIAEAKKHTRKTRYISNIQVIKHPARPEDEGKIFLFAYGKQVMDCIESLMYPDPAFGEPQRYPFDFWNGANFRLKIREVDGWPNYTKSSFDGDSQLADDETLEQIYNGLYSLKAEIAPDKFKTYEQLLARRNLVLGLEDEANTNTSKGRNFDREVNNEVDEGSDDVADTPPWETEEEAVTDDDTEFLKKLTA